MKNFELAEIVKNLHLKVEVGDRLLKREVTGCYVSDLLSDVMANAKKGDIWVTLQTHPNIVAVAVLKEISGIIIPANRKLEPETIKKAEQEKIPIMTTDLSGFEVVGRLYGLLK
ncbi:MAG: DRTGG domain-containing protein [candidate division WOR-3 bacterium]